MDNAMRDRLLGLYEELNVAVMVISADEGELLFYNRHVKSALGKAAEELGGQHYASIFEEDFARFYTALAAECADSETHTRVFFWESRMIWEQVSAVRVEWLAGKAATLLSITNITEVSQSEYLHKRIAYYDRLLCLPNGQRLEDDIAAMENFEHAALIHFDINRFASVNELYGWAAGDQLLRQIRDWLLLSLRETSKLYRTNDDEFCLFIQNISHKEVEKRAEEILARFAQPWELSVEGAAVQVFCTLEMGVVYGQYVKGDMRNILYRTTHMLHKNGRGYTLYDEEMDRRLREEELLRHNLINCVKDGMRGFEVYYQPIVRAADGHWMGAEALCRWTSPQGTPVSPGVFIPEIERLGLVGELDMWVRETAMVQCIKWGLSNRRFFLDMNLSPLQPVNERFVRGFLSMAERHGYPRNRITLEITESAKMKFNHENLSILRLLRDEGIILALDDFGTGYSTLENLVNIPAGVLKTERLLTTPVEHDPYYQYLMHTMVNIAHTVGMVLIAEGVETEGQCKLLRAYGADYLQGYLFAKPMPPQAFAQRLGEFSA